MIRLKNRNNKKGTPSCEGNVPFLLQMIVIYSVIESPSETVVMSEAVTLSVGGISTVT